MWDSTTERDRTVEALDRIACRLEDIRAGIGVLCCVFGVGVMAIVLAIKA